MKQILFFIINFQKENENALTLLIILVVKSLQIELHSFKLYFFLFKIDYHSGFIFDLS